MNEQFIEFIHELHIKFESIKSVSEIEYTRKFINELILRTEAMSFSLASEATLESRLASLDPSIKSLVLCIFNFEWGTEKIKSLFKEKSHQLEYNILRTLLFLSGENGPFPDWQHSDCARSDLLIFSQLRPLNSIKSVYSKNDYEKHILNCTRCMSLYRSFKEVSNKISSLQFPLLPREIDQMFERKKNIPLVRRFQIPWYLELTLKTALIVSLLGSIYYWNSLQQQLASLLQAIKNFLANVF